MLLRRVIGHVKDQNWIAVFIDFLIVVIGVFVGLQVQNWATEQGQRQLEKSYMARLHDEVVDLQKTRKPLLDSRNRWQAGLSSVTSLLFNEDSREITQAECLSVALSHIVSNPTDNLATLIELQESGQMFLFKNKDVSKSLRSFLLARSRARDAMQGVSLNNVNLRLKHPHLVKIVKPMSQKISPQGIFTRTGGIYECDLESMRSNQSFLNDFEISQSGFGNHIGHNILVSSSLIEIHRVLDEVLGLTH